MGYEEPKSLDLAVRALLDGRDADRTATLVHNLLTELAGLAVRVEALEARLDGRKPPEGQEAVQAVVGALVRRVAG